MTEERLDRIQKHVYDALKTIQPEPFWTDFHDVIAEVRRLQNWHDSRSSLLVTQGKEIDVFRRERDEAKEENQSLRELLFKVGNHLKTPYSEKKVETDWLIKRIDAALGEK